MFNHYQQRRRLVQRDFRMRRRQRDQHPTGFTLVELLVVTTIIAILATTMLFALAGATEAAKRRRARTQVARIHELIAEKWESYETRSVNLVGTGPRFQRNVARLTGLRELMRYEMPDRVSDLFEGPTLPATAPYGTSQTPRTPVFIPMPALAKFYQRQAARTDGWTPDNEGAECLHLILSRIELGDGFAISSFPDGDIGDTDGDGMLEILDAWGRPMQFIRWPAGFDQPSTYQDPTVVTAAAADIDESLSDAFDVTGLAAGFAAIDTDDDGVVSATEYTANGGTTAAFGMLDSHGTGLSTFANGQVSVTYAIFPLVYSTGSDGVANIWGDSQEFHNAGGYTSTANDPYATIPTGAGQVKIGSVDNPTSNEHVDNITNHALGLTE